MRGRLGHAALVLVALATAASAQEAPGGAARYAEDFDAFWQAVADRYVYLGDKATDWPRVREVYGPEAAAAGDDRAFLNVLERAVGELYDDHAGFDTNNGASPRLVPSGTDVWAEWRGGRAVVTAVRAGSAAGRVGLRPGSVVTHVGGRPVEEAVRDRAPRTLRRPDPAARDWALRAVLAGTHAGPVAVTVEGRPAPLSFTPGVDRPAAPLTVRRLGRGGAVGVIRVHDALGDGRLVAAWDSALATLRDTRGLVLDLRDTPGGGTTAVARGLMGRLVARERPYQRHSVVERAGGVAVPRVWAERVVPRGWTYARPVVVLVGRWTGSMGEGLAVGLDGAGRATVVGTPMAGLAGAVSVVRLPNTGVGVRLPTERLFHVDGTPREAFVPPVAVRPASPGEDPALEAAVRVLGRL